MKIIEGLSQYEEYLDSLIFGCAFSGSESRYVLDGQSQWALNKIVPREFLHQNGIYFTGSSLSGRLISPYKNKISKSTCLIVDPACGSGDLLIAAARHLPLRKSLHATLLNWSGRIHGFDVQNSFVRICRRRLILLAIHRHLLRGDSRRLAINRPDDYFKSIVLGDFLISNDPLPGGLILMNPPFVPMRSSTSWGNGKINMAAVFFAKVLSRATKGATIAAILPDVLRSGSRYKAWREFVQVRLRSGTVREPSKFNNGADIDVFLLEGSRNSNNRPISWYIRGALANVASTFQVAVGSVVPHRDRQVGAKTAYFHTGNLAPWKTIAQPSETRRHSSRVYGSPAVVIRRTSSPGENPRVVASLINLNKSFAAENHLIVVAPFDGKLGTCRKLMAILKSSTTTRWMNRRIRCRHLTVSAVKEIPFGNKQ